jgi:hypothetical protein
VRGDDGAEQIIDGAFQLFVQPGHHRPVDQGSVAIVSTKLNCCIKALKKF